jgi:hypothetical protein
MYYQCVRPQEINPNGKNIASSKKAKQPIETIMRDGAIHPFQHKLPHWVHMNSACPRSSVCDVRLGSAHARVFAMLVTLMASAGPIGRAQTPARNFATLRITVNVVSVLRTGMSSVPPSSRRTESPQVSTGYIDMTTTRPVLQRSEEERRLTDSVWQAGPRLDQSRKSGRNYTLTKGIPYSDSPMGEGVADGFRDSPEGTDAILRTRTIVPE